MFDVISRIPGDKQLAPHKGGQATGASSALYDQILRSVLQAMEVPVTVAVTAATPMQEAPSQGLRTLEDVMMQRQFVCSLDDTNSALPFEQIALQQQPLVPEDQSSGSQTNALLNESLSPWELLLGRLTLQQRLAD